MSERTLRRAWLIVFLLIAHSALGQPVRQDRVDEASVARAAQSLRAAIFQAVREAGGDLDRQHVHLVLAFSTGHFNKDPLRAQAGRLLAWYLVRDTLVQGDLLSCLAWELSVWDHRRGQSRTVTVDVSGRDDPAKQNLQDLFPTTVQDGSMGGHDTERAIVGIVREIGNVPNAVMVLITNDAQSVAPRGYQTIGTDNPEYQQVLTQWRRLPQVSESGASQRIAFTIVTADGSRTERGLDIVTVTPVRFSGNTLATPRASLLQSQPARLHRRDAPIFDLASVLQRFALVLLGLLTLAVLVMAFARSRRVRIPKSLRFRIGTEFVPFGSAEEGETLCILAGREYKPSEDEKPKVISVMDGVSQKIATLYREHGKLVVQAEEAQLQSMDGVPADTQTVPLQPGKNHQVRFMVKTRPPAGPVQRKLFSVDICWDTHEEKEATPK